MHDLHLLADFLLIVSLAMVVVWLFHKLQVPSLVGLLIAGVFIGPGGFGLITGQEEIDLLADIGAVLLLFSIGLQFSLRDVTRIRRLVLGGGGLQMSITAALVITGALIAGVSFNVSIFWGALIALSSTIIVLDILQESGELTSVHGQSMLGILIFQDLAVVALMLLTPILADQTPGLADVAWILFKALGVVVGLWLLATYGFPRLIERVVKTRQRELFTLVTVLVAIGTAYIAGLVGLSLALGAFLGGLVISESQYSHQMLSEVLPFRDLFNSLFFVSVGMLFQPSIFLEMPWTLGGLLLATFALKALVAGVAMLLLGYGARIALLVGLGLAQVGEFAFVLAREGLRVELLDPDQYSIFLAVSVVTMAATPLLFRLSDWTSRHLESVGPSPLERMLGPVTRPGDTDKPPVEHRQDHVIIVGYGLNGRNVARGLRRIDVPYVIVEMNDVTVEEHKDEEPIFFGDAARRSTLEALGARNAHALVVAIADAPTTRSIVTQAREINSELYVVVRTRYTNEINRLYDLGASEVIPEEFETSLALVGTVLESYGVSAVDIMRQRERIRAESYDLLRLPSAPEASRTRLTLKELVGRSSADIVRVSQNAAAVGKSIRDLDLRARFGVSVVGILREGEMNINPAPDWQLESYDELIVLGEPDGIQQVRDELRKVEIVGG